MEGGGGYCRPHQLGRKPFHSGNFSERAIGNLGNFSDCLTDLYDISC